MIISTTPTIEWKPIKEYLWLISSEVIVWANVVKDIFASLTDFFGGRSGSYESALIKWKNEAMEELKAKAKKMWADAIIGIDMDYEAIGKGSMFMINISGTAVKLTK